MPILMRIGLGDLSIELDKGEWIFRKLQAYSAPVGSKRIMSLLPLLQTPILELRNNLEIALLKNGLPAEHLDSFPFNEIVQYALKWPTDYWVDLAIGWLEDQVDLERDLVLLKAVSEKKHFPQPLRHRAMRLLNKAVAPVPSVVPPVPTDGSAPVTVPSVVSPVSTDESAPKEGE